LGSVYQLDLALTIARAAKGLQRRGAGVQAAIPTAVVVMAAKVVV
jgi:hypothetical protein